MIHADCSSTIVSAKPRPFRSLVVASACVAAMVLALGGCVSAESTRYRETMSHSVAPDRTASAEVARAFEIERRDTAPPASLAIVGE